MSHTILSAKTALLLLALAGGFSSVCRAQTIFDLNADFVDNETPNGGEVNPFGQYTYGYSLNPSNPAAFSTVGLTHTDAFAGFANIEGYFINNSALVPAILVNTNNAPNATSFATFQPHEIHLHPGGLTGDAFAGPHADGILRYTVPEDGEYDVVGSFRSMNFGTVDSRVLLNGVALADLDNNDGAFSLLDLQLSAGDFIDFAVGAAGDIGGDSTGLTATITQAAAVPEPAALACWVILGAALIGYGARLRRNKSA